LAEIGEMANKYWLEIPEHFPFVKLDVHGITILISPGNPVSMTTSSEMTLNTNE
jgi:hypothetical protein